MAEPEPEPPQPRPISAARWLLMLVPSVMFTGVAFLLPTVDRLLKARVSYDLSYFLRIRLGLGYTGELIFNLTVYYALPLIVSFSLGHYLDRKLHGPRTKSLRGTYYGCGIILVNCFIIFAGCIMVVTVGKK